MSRNRAHNNTKKVIEDIIEGPPQNSINFLILAIDQFFNNELQTTATSKQTGLLFLGVHASILTLSEALFGNGKLEGYKKFLELFMDGKHENEQFSKIASLMHGWRNTLAHRFISETGHNIEYDYNMEAGWVLKADELTINPKLYLTQYLDAFQEKILYRYVSELSPEALASIKERIVIQYKRK